MLWEIVSQKAHDATIIIRCPVANGPGKDYEKRVTNLESAIELADGDQDIQNLMVRLKSAQDRGKESKRRLAALQAAEPPRMNLKDIQLRAWQISKLLKTGDITELREPIYDMFREIRVNLGLARTRREGKRDIKRARETLGGKELGNTLMALVKASRPMVPIVTYVYRWDGLAEAVEQRRYEELERELVDAENTPPFKPIEMYVEEEQLIEGASMPRQYTKRRRRKPSP